MHDISCTSYWPKWGSIRTLLKQQLVHMIKLLSNAYQSPHRMSLSITLVCFKLATWMTEAMSFRYQGASISLLETFTGWLPEVLWTNIIVNLKCYPIFCNKPKDIPIKEPLVMTVSHSLRWNVCALLCYKICHNICEATWGPNISACFQLKQTIGKHIGKELGTDLRQALLLSLHWWHVCFSLQMAWTGKRWLDLADPVKIWKALIVEDLVIWKVHLSGNGFKVTHQDETQVGVAQKKMGHFKKKKNGWHYWYFSAWFTV